MSGLCSGFILSKFLFFLHTIDSIIIACYISFLEIRIRRIRAKFVFLLINKFCDCAGPCFFLCLHEDWIIFLIVCILF